MKNPDHIRKKIFYSIIYLGLVRIIDTQLVPAKHLFITTTVALLFFTIGIQVNNNFFSMGFYATSNSLRVHQ